MENGFGSNVTRSENGDNVEYVINIEGQAKALVDANSQLENTAANYQQAEDFLARNIGIKSSPDVSGEKSLTYVVTTVDEDNPQNSDSLSSKDESRPLNLKTDDVDFEVEEKKIKKYVPLSKRQDKPDAALWLIKQHNTLKDSQISKLVGITKNSVSSIRNKNYWNYNNLNPKDPVAMGLFNQKDLILALEKADRRIKREKKIKEKLNISTNNNQ